MKFPLTLASLLLVVSSASGTVTLQFNSATNGSLQNFANTTGVGGTPMVWGILIDTAGNGLSHDTPGSHYSFSGVSYTGSVPQTLSLLEGGTATDDVLVLSPNLMNLQSGEVDGMPAGTNRVTSLASVPLSSGISPGDPFAVVWFQNTTTPAGAFFQGLAIRYGGVNNPGFVIPADGNTTSFANLFTGPDALKLMNYASGPEPSTTLLGLLGAATLLRRRR